MAREHVGVRLDPELLIEVDRYRTALQLRVGIPVSRTAALEKLIRVGLASEAGGPVSDAGRIPGGAR